MSNAFVKVKGLTMRLWIWVCPQREIMNGLKLQSASLGFNDMHSQCNDKE